MAATVAGVFADQASALAAIGRLRAEGVAAGDISLITRESADAGGATEVKSPGTATVGSDAAAGIATGGLLGGLGGLLVGMGAIVLPGVGPVIAAGPLAAALGGAAVGAAAGGLIGALADADVPEEHAAAYAAHLEKGRVLLMVRTEPELQPAVAEILAASGATELFPSKTTLT
jgi:hypothetical protein